MQSVCFDTQILIWGVQRTSKPSQADMIKRTETLLKQLDRNKTRIVVPSIALGEFLLGIPLEQHMATVAIFKKRFMVAPYDAQAAEIFVQLWNSYNNQTHQDNEEKPSRTFLRADAMIVATAIARDVDTIYTDDPWFEKFAGLSVHVDKISDIPIQGDFLDLDNNPS